MGDVYDAQRIAERIEEQLLPLVTRLQKKVREHKEREQQRARQKEKELHELSLLENKVREQQEGCLCDGDYVPLWELAWQLYEEDKSINAEERQRVKEVSEALWAKFLGVVPTTSRQARKHYHSLLSLYQVPALVLSTAHSPQQTSFLLYNKKKSGGKVKLCDSVIYFDVITPDIRCHTFFISAHTDSYFGSVDKNGKKVAHTFMKELPLRQRILMMLPFITDQQLTLGTSLLLTQEITRRQQQQ